MTTDAPERPAETPAPAAPRKRGPNKQPAPARPRTRAAQARRPSATEVFLQENEGVKETVRDRGVGSDGEMQTFTHTSAKLVVLYRATTWGWESVEVPSTNIRMCIEAGMRYNCGDCDDNCSPDPMNPQYNNCPGRPKFATMRCPNCGRLAYDFESRMVNADLMQGLNDVRVADADGTEVEDPAFAKLKPTDRLSALNAQHMRRYHPDEAEARGLGRESSGR